jgi:TolB-like protein
MRRRHVFRTAAIYIVAAWVLLEVIALAFQSFGIPDTALQYIWLAAIAGFPLALIFGWRYDITPEGIVRTPPVGVTDTTDLSLRKPDYIVLAALAVIAVIFVGSTINEIRQGPLRGAGPWFAVDRLVTAIAVLPLENLSGDTSQKFLSAGLHDALITTLSRITRFRVTSRYSSRRVNAKMSFPQIGRLLGVDKILSGSVLREGDEVRVNVTLVDAETEQALWTESFTREFDGLISKVKVQLTPDEERQLAPTDGPDSATYEAYLRGMFQLHKGSPRGYRRAIKIFTEAVENDPTSALAYAGLAIGYAQLGHSPFPAAGAYPRAKEAAQPRRRHLQYLLRVGLPGR